MALIDFGWISKKPLSKFKSKKKIQLKKEKEYYSRTLSEFGKFIEHNFIKPILSTVFVFVVYMGGPFNLFV